MDAIDAARSKAPAVLELDLEELVRNITGSVAYVPGNCQAGTFIPENAANFDPSKTSTFEVGAQRGRVRVAILYIDTGSHGLGKRPNIGFLVQ